MDLVFLECCALWHVESSFILFQKYFLEMLLFVLFNHLNFPFQTLQFAYSESPFSVLPICPFLSLTLSNTVSISFHESNGCFHSYDDSTSFFYLLVPWILPVYVLHSPIPHSFSPALLHLCFELLLQRTNCLFKVAVLNSWSNTMVPIFSNSMEIFFFCGCWLLVFFLICFSSTPIYFFSFLEVCFHSSCTVSFFLLTHLWNKLFLDQLFLGRYIGEEPRSGTWFGLGRNMIWVPPPLLQPTVLSVGLGEFFFQIPNLFSCCYRDRLLPPWELTPSVHVSYSHCCKQRI